MGYRWNKNTIDDKTIVEAREFDQAHNGFTSLVNGGMDRENLPEECIGQASLMTRSFGRADITGNVYTPYDQTSQDSNYGAPYSNQNTRGNRIVGMKYGSDPINEGDSFFEVTTMDVPTEEGMLKLTWKCSAYMPMYWAWYKGFTTAKSTRKRYQWRIEVNGITVYDAPAICQPFYTIDIGINVPIGKGTQRVSVSLRYPGRTDDDNNTVLLEYWGGQLTSHNIYR